MKYTIIAAFLLIFCGNMSAQTDFMALGSTVRTQASAFGFSGSAVFNAEKDTMCNGAPCRKVTIKYTNKIANRPFRDDVVFFQQRGDSIFQYTEYLKKSGFLFKNKHNVGDSFRIEQTIGTTVVTRATVYIDSLIQLNGVKRYASRIACRPRAAGDTLMTARFNLYDKLIPDYNWDLYGMCNAAFNDDFYYTPLCYTEATLSYQTPSFTGSCDSIARVTTVKEADKSIDLVIYPNPTTAYLNIKSGQNQSAKIRIWNVNGVECLQKTLTLLPTSTNAIDIQHLSNGLYIVSVQTDKGFEKTQKLVVHH
jgi:hypothetical protein